MKAYHQYILEAIREFGEEAFAVNIRSAELLEGRAFEKLGDRAAQYAYEASINGHHWNGLARILHTRYTICGGSWYLVQDLETTIPVSLPRIALYTPTTEHKAREYFHKQLDRNIGSVK